MSLILQSWDKALQREIDANPNFAVSRRQFLLGTTGLAGAAFLLPSWLEAAQKSTLNSKKSDKILTSEPWLTIEVVYNHLFPPPTDSKDDSPGAKQIKATEYLFLALQAPDIEKSQRQFVEKGVKWLNQFSVTEYKKPFSGLSNSDREKALRKIEKSKAGRRWIATLMDFLFEALLADPVYGGNPDGIGWKWLDHSPGFPRPPKNKRYFLLT